MHPVHIAFSLFPSEVRAVLHDIYSAQPQGYNQGVGLLGGAIAADLVLTWPPQSHSSPQDSASNICPSNSYMEQVALQRLSAPTSYSIDNPKITSSLSFYTSNGPHIETGDAWIERRLLELGGLRPVFLPKHVWKAWAPVSSADTAVATAGEEEMMLIYSLVEDEIQRGNIREKRQARKKACR